MKTDTLNRRIRFAAPQPHNNELVLTPSDLAVFDAIHTHGPLPTNYLFQFSGKASYKEFQHRLTRLYNGGADGPGYLTRPPQQFNSFYARYQPLIYDLSKRGEKAVQERGTWNKSLKRTDAFLHRFMAACVSASFEIGCRNRGHAFISAAAIFARPGCKHPDLSLPVTVLGHKALEPDLLFGIRFKDGKHRFYAVEVDRNTESIQRKFSGQNTFAKKVQAYFEVCRNRTYRTFWDVPNLRVLTVTTNATHMRNILDYLADEPDLLKERFLFQAYPDFGMNWSVPREALSHLFSEPWHNTAGTELLQA